MRLYASALPKPLKVKCCLILVMAIAMGHETENNFIDLDRTVPMNINGG